MNWVNFLIGFKKYRKRRSKLGAVCQEARLVQSSWSSFGQKRELFLPFFALFSYHKKMAKKEWVFCTMRKITKNVVKNAWVCRTRKYWAEIVVRNAYVFSTSTNIGRTRHKMREYFVPTIIQTTRMSLFVCRKYSRILYRNLSPEKRGTKCVSILYHIQN